MPNIKSAKKRVKVIAVKTARNKANRTALKNEIEKAVAAGASGSVKIGHAVALTSAVETTVFVRLCQGLS